MRGDQKARDQTPATASLERPVSSVTIRCAIRSERQASVREGLIPMASGNDAAAATYRPGYPKTAPAWFTTPLLASVPMLHPPSGWGVINHFKSVHVGETHSLPPVTLESMVCMAMMASVGSRSSGQSSSRCLPHGHHHLCPR